MFESAFKGAQQFAPKARKRAQKPAASTKWVTGPAYDEVDRLALRLPPPSDLKD